MLYVCATWLVRERCNVESNFRISFAHHGFFAEMYLQRWVRLQEKRVPELPKRRSLIAQTIDDNWGEKSQMNIT